MPFGHRRLGSLLKALFIYPRQRRGYNLSRPNTELYFRMDIQLSMPKLQKVLALLLSSTKS